MGRDSQQQNEAPEISLKHVPLKVKEDSMQMRRKCSCKRKGCNPDTLMFSECGALKIWAESFRYKGKYYGRSLKTSNEKEAIGVLALRFDDINKGVSPKLNKKFKEVLEDYYFWAIDESQKSDSALKDIKGRLSKNLTPVFSDFKISEITPAHVKQYKGDREESGAAKGTIKKELEILRDIIHLFDPGFIMPSFKRWANVGRKVLAALTDEEVLAVADKVLLSSPEFRITYWTLFWLMVFTGLDVGDAVSLEKSQIVDNCIYKNRGKTNQKIAAYLVPEARELLAGVPILDISGKYFKVPSNKAVTTAILRAFKKAGVEGNSKGLRHFAATQYELAGLDKATIRSILGHAIGSNIVDVYTHGQKQKMDRAFSGLKSTGLLKKAGAGC